MFHFEVVQEGVLDLLHGLPLVLKRAQEPSENQVDRLQAERSPRGDHRSSRQLQ